MEYEENLLFTPEGVRDIYGVECEKRRQVEAGIHSIMNLYGFQDIQTPTFEFFDIFKRERGTVESKEMFKFFDRDNNTLVLKPDMTPAIARCVSKYFFDEKAPLRLCYLERTFTNNTSYQGRLKESTQTGAEMIGDDSSDADGEMIALAIESLLAAGLEEFQLSIGEVEYFKGLCRQAGLDDETELALRDFISGKNIFGAENLLQEKGIDPESCDLLLGITDYFGSMDFIERAKGSVHNSRSLEALSRLEKLYQVLCGYGVEKNQHRCKCDA